MSTLRTYMDLEQRTEDWYALRRGLVTASAVGVLVTPTLKVADNEGSRGLTASLLAERITGVTEATFTSDDMMRGILEEPLARDRYAQHYKRPVRECGFMIRDFDGFSIGLSPDGLVGDHGLIEIKAPRAKGHILTILADEVPAYYMAQCQTALLVSGRKWLDYVSWHGGLPLYVKRVTPDPQWHDAICNAVKAFEERAAQMLATYNTATEGLAATDRALEIEELVI